MHKLILIVLLSSQIELLPSFLLFLQLLLHLILLLKLLLQSNIKLVNFSLILMFNTLLLFLVGKLKGSLGLENLHLLTPLLIILVQFLIIKLDPVICPFPFL